MADIVYEGLFILDANRYARDAAGVSGQVADQITKAGGAILANRLWEERRLAYPISGHRKGTYWLTYFRLESCKLNELKRQFELSESVLRTLFLKVEPRIVDALVSHALAGPTAKKPAEPAVAAPVAVAVPVAVATDETPEEE